MPTKLFDSCLGSFLTDFDKLVELLRRQVSVNNFQRSRVLMHDALLAIREPTDNPAWCAVYA